MTDTDKHTPKTLRQIIALEFSDAALDCQCTSLKVSLKTPSGGTFKTDYSERRAKSLALAKGGEA